MPKVVDHDARRVELIEATWRIIARHGMDGATLREVAAEAGFANGALKPYFPTKSSLIEATYRHVFGRTNQRAATSTAGLGGVAALRAFALEVLPLDEERVDEARVVIPFWQGAVHDAGQARLHADTMDQWRHQIRGWLEEVSDTHRQTDASTAAEAVLTFLLGAQVSAVLPSAGRPVPGLEAQLDALLGAFIDSGAARPSRAG